MPIAKGLKVEEAVVVHHCTQEAVIGEMMGLMKRMVLQVYGNGQKGLAFSVPELSTKIDGLTEQVHLLNVTVSGVAKFQAEMIGEVRTEEKMKLNTRQWTQIIVASIIGVSSIAVALLIKFL